jgi:hypothetical protein
MTKIDHIMTSHQQAEGVGRSHLSLRSSTLNLEVVEIRRRRHLDSRSLDLRANYLEAQALTLWQRH